MKKFIATAAVAAFASVTLGGCETMDDSQRRTATGAGVGAAAGAAIGAMGNDSNRGRGAAAGAAIGAAAGALGGYVWNKRMESQQKQIQQNSQGTGVEVTRTPDNRLQIVIPGDIAFDSGQAVIRPNFRRRSIILRSHCSKIQLALYLSLVIPTQPGRHPPTSRCRCSVPMPRVIIWSRAALLQTVSPSMAAARASRLRITTPMPAAHATAESKFSWVIATRSLR